MQFLDLLGLAGAVLGSVTALEFRPRLRLSGWR